VKKQWIASSAIAALVLGTLSGCGSTNNSTSANSPATTPGTSTASSSTLNVGLSADPPKLDPSLSSALVDRQVMMNIYDTLFQLTPENQVAPDLVQSYTQSTDGKTYTFKLQQGVTFQDGTPFNAAAVKFNIQRDQLKISSRHSALSPIVSIDTPDDYTVVLHLKAPFSPLLAVFTGRSGMMVSPTAVKKEGASFVNNPVGTGPYQFKDRIKGDHITLTKNPNYWQKSAAGHFSTVVYKIFTDPNVELTNLQSGAVQIVDTVPAQQLPTLAQNTSYVVSNKPGLGYQGFYLNVQTAPFNNVDLRDAVNAAIDRQVLVNAILKGVASPGYGPLSSASPAYDAASDTAPTPDATTIKKFLSLGGKPSGFSFTMQAAANPVTEQMMQIIQSMLAKYGITMKIQQLEFGTLLANNETHAFQASQLGWSGRLDPDQDIYPFFVTGGPQNGSAYSNPQVDQLLKKAREQSSMADRTQTYAQVMTLLHQDAPYVFLYHQNNVFAYTKNLQGFQAYADGVLRVASLSMN